MKKHKLRIEALRTAQNVGINRGYAANIESIIEVAEKCYSFLVQDDKEDTGEGTRGGLDPKSAKPREYPYLGRLLSGEDEVYVVFSSKRSGILLKDSSRISLVSPGEFYSNWDEVYFDEVKL